MYDISKNVHKYPKISKMSKNSKNVQKCPKCLKCTSESKESKEAKQYNHVVLVLVLDIDIDIDKKTAFFLSIKSTSHDLANSFSLVTNITATTPTYLQIKFFSHAPYPRMIFLSLLGDVSLAPR